MNEISVIICTYNPEILLLERCIDDIINISNFESIREVLIINNNSDPSIFNVELFNNIALKSKKIKYIFENKQGLTHARLLGIKNSNSEYLVFLDDDNFVAVNFINEALRVFNEFPWIGSFSGQIDLKFEHVPPAWTKKYWNLLAFRKFNGNHWSNVYFDNNCMPCGAGLCVRRSVAEKYFEMHYNGTRSIILDRTKGSLLSGGDNDLAMCAIDLGMGVGIFESLKLSHYIPRFRTEIEYLKQLAYNIYFSSVILKYVRGYGVERIKFKTLFKRIILLITLPSCDRIIQFSCLRGELDAYKFINPK